MNASSTVLALTTAMICSSDVGYIVKANILVKILIRSSYLWNQYGQLSETVQGPKPLFRNLATERFKTYSKTSLTPVFHTEPTDGALLDIGRPLL